MNGPLSGFRIIDVCRAEPGKWATGLLADYGADVITVIEPGYEEGRVQRGQMPIEHALVNPRQKRSVFVNLRQDAGRQVILDLAKVSDGFLESNRPGVAKRLSIDYDAVRAVNPSIVYCSLSGFGQYGPYADISARDLSYQGIGGLLPLDEEGRPHPAHYAQGDLNAAWSAATAMLMALLERSKSGEGQYIDVAFCDACVTIPPGGYPEAGIHGEYAAYNTYETKDGEYLTLSTREIPCWERLCHLLGRPDWIPHLSQREAAVRDEQLAAFRDFFKQKTLAEWVEILHQHQVQFGPVNRRVDQLRADPQLRSREMVLEVTSPVTGAKRYEPGFVFKFSRTPTALRRGPTMIGVDTDNVLLELGYDPDRIAALRNEKVIG